MVLYQSKRSARRSQDEWCGLWHIGTHLFREYNHQWFSFPLSVEWYVNCKVAGNCSVEITCVRCKKEIVGVVDEIYMKIFENCRGKEHDQEKASRYSTDMEALRQRKRAM